MIERAQEFGGGVAERASGMAKHLEELGVQDLGQDLVSMIRRYPIPSLLVSVGVGFLIGRVTGARR